MFFFSSRRRHTRSLCDWSSDVCSSDLGHGTASCSSRVSSPVAVQELDRRKPLDHRSECKATSVEGGSDRRSLRSEEHTSELQSHSDLVCRLLLEKKKHTDERHTSREHR